MKFILTFLLLCSLIISNTEANELIEKAKQFGQVCKESSGASDADFQNFLNYKPQTTDKGKCMNECILKKSGVLDENNKLNEATLLEFIKIGAAGDANLEKIGIAGLQPCLNLPQLPNSCENAAALSACYFENLHKKGFKGLPA